MHRCHIWVVLVITFLISSVYADVIPFCPTAILKSEFVTVTLRCEQGSVFADFQGDFTLDDLWPQYGTMVFPIPANATDFSVAKITDGVNEHLDTYWYMKRDYGTDGWPMVQSYYPTVLPEMPELPIKLWNSPSEGEEIFRVSYSHELLRRGDEFVFIYALGAEDFPHPLARPVSLTGDIEVLFDIIIPDSISVTGAYYDTAIADSAEISAKHLIFTPEGPLHDDIIATFTIAPEPGSLLLLAVGALYCHGLRKRRK